MATIKDLVGHGPDDLEKMSDEELQRVCEPYLRIAPTVQQPLAVDSQGEISLEGEDKKEQRQTKRVKTKEDLMEQIRKLAALHGVDAGIPTPIK